MAKAVTSADIEAKLKELIYNTNKNVHAGIEGHNRTFYRSQYRSHWSKGRRKNPAQNVEDSEMSHQFDSTSRQLGFSATVSSSDGNLHSRPAKQVIEEHRVNKMKKKMNVQQYKEKLNSVSTNPISSGPVGIVPDEKSRISKVRKSKSEKHKNGDSRVIGDEKLRTESYEKENPVWKKKRKRKKKNGYKETSSNEDGTKLKMDKQHTVRKPVVQDKRSANDHSVVSGNAKSTAGVAEYMLLILEKERIFPLKKTSLRFPRATYFCRICDYHCDAIPDCKKHMKDLRHKRNRVSAEKETELRKIPAPCVRQVQALDRVIEDVYREFGLNDGDIDYRKQRTVELEMLLQKDLPGIGLQLYGSSLTGFGLKNSDINIDLIVPKSVTAPEALLIVFKVMKNLDNYEQVQSDFSAKIPSVSFKEKKSDIFCRITINSTLAYLSNQLLAVYSGIDEKTRKLAVALRYWAKLCKLDRQAEGTIPSYCLALMTVYYLQQCPRSVLPVIVLETADCKKTENNAKKTWTFDYDQFKVIADKWETKNTDSLGQLWVKMLKFYSLTYDYASDVICIKQVVLKRAEKKWNNKRIAIEDPFYIKRNAARSVSNSQVFEYILDCFKRTYKYFGLPTGTQDLPCVTKSLQDKAVGKQKCQPARSIVIKCDQDPRNKDNTKNSVMSENLEQETFSELTSNTPGLSTAENDMANRIAERILSNIINQVTARETNDSPSKEIISEFEIVIDKSEPHSRHPSAPVNDDVCSSSEQLHIGNSTSSIQSDITLDGKSSFHQSDILLEYNSDQSDGQPVDVPVSLAITSEVNSDNLFANESCSQEASDALLASPDCHSELNSTEKEKLVTVSKGKDNAVLVAACDEQSGSLSSKLVDKLSDQVVKQTMSTVASSSVTACELSADKRLCSGHVNNTDLTDNFASESPKLTLSSLKTVSDSSNSDVSENLDLSCINTYSDSDTESEEESDKESEDGKEVKSSEEYAVEMSDAKEMEDKQSRGEYYYMFSSKYFCDDIGPAVICSICDKEGHLKHGCPQNKLPELQKLPPMTPWHLQSLTRTLRNVPLDFAQTSEDFQMRDRIRRDLEKFIQDLFPDAKLILFGSSCNGFGFRQSDLDLCLTFRKERENVNSVELIEILTHKLRTHRGLYHVFPITSAKVPIVKFKHRQSRLEGDISLSNLLAQHNTELLFAYSCIDPKVSILGYAIKVFAKVCDIGDASKGSLSSYAYVLMLLHYLQNCNPPVIPVLQELFPGDKKPEIIIEGVNAWFYNDIKNLRNVWPHYGKNQQSVGELWLGLFRYYTEDFSLKDDVICIRQLEPLTRFGKLWNGSCLAIEDPFNLSHNLGGGLSRRMNNYIMRAFINGRQIYGTPIHAVPQIFSSPEDYFFDAEQLTEGKPPSDRCCHVCNKIGHIAKECPVIVAKKLREEKEKQWKRENAGRERDSKMEQDHPSPMRSISVRNEQERFSDRQRVRGQVFVNTAFGAQSDPSGKASNPVQIQRSQTNYSVRQQIPALLTRSPQALPCSPPSPARRMCQQHSSEPLVGTKPSSLHQCRDGPSTPPRHIYAASGQSSPVVVVQDEFYRGSPPARCSPKKWKQ